MNSKIDSFAGAFRFLSNFYYSPITYDGIEYLHVEGAFQAAKATDLKDRERIAKLKSPADAKAEGRKVNMREDWQDVKLRVMEDCLRLKFSPGSQMARSLAATGDLELIEGNWWNDTFWGVCRGKGENHLGKLLMKIREEQKTCNLSYN